jgi:hypothetical protein
MTKTMSIRMDRNNYEFLTEISKEERCDLSKAVRDLVSRGRVLLAVENPGFTLYVTKTLGESVKPG